MSRSTEGRSRLRARFAAAFFLLAAGCFLSAYVLGIWFARHEKERSTALPTTSSSGCLKQEEPIGNLKLTQEATVQGLKDAIALANAWTPDVAQGSPSLYDRRAALEIAPGDHVLGDNQATITLMLFGDLACPYTLNTLRLLRLWLDQHPRAYRLVFRHRPLDIHPTAPKAAQIAERLAFRAGEASFWKFLRILSETDGTATEATLLDLEQRLQLSRPRLSEPAADVRAIANLERDRLIALRYSIHATPTIFINGLRLEGEASRLQLERMVSEEREAVDELLADSVPRPQIYLTRVHENLLDLEPE